MEINNTEKIVCSANFYSYDIQVISRSQQYAKLKIIHISSVRLQIHASLNKYSTSNSFKALEYFYTSLYKDIKLDILSLSINYVTNDNNIFICT